MTVGEAIARVVDRGVLSEPEMIAVCERLFAGDATPAQVGALLIGLRLRGETVDELTGAARAVRAHALAIPDVPAAAIDTCGTGGDGLATLNVSTGAALIVAAAGVPVAKHGNRAVSGSVGAADVLEALGVTIELPPAALGVCLRTVGFAFLYAPALHPALRHVASVRRELGVRTLFNLLGPLANPARVRRQLVGVVDPDRVEAIAQVLQRLGHERAWVVHGPGGLDELGLDGPSSVAELAGGRIRTFRIDPRETGLGSAAPTALRVGSTAEAAARLRAVLAGAAGPDRDVILLNAAAALVVAGVTSELRDGVQRAAGIVDGGEACALLERLVAFTAKAGAAR